MSERHIPLASIRAVEALADANRAPVVRAFAFASVTLPDATYYAETTQRGASEKVWSGER